MYSATARRPIGWYSALTRPECRRRYEPPVDEVGDLVGEVVAVRQAGDGDGRRAALFLEPVAARIERSLPRRVADGTMFAASVDWPASAAIATARRPSSASRACAFAYARRSSEAPCSGIAAR
jgi:hypothetical protein